MKGKNEERREKEKVGREKITIWELKEIRKRNMKVVVRRQGRQEMWIREKRSATMGAMIERNVEL